MFLLMLGDMHLRPSVNHVEEKALQHMKDQTKVFHYLQEHCCPSLQRLTSFFDILCAFNSAFILSTRGYK